MARLHHRPGAAVRRFLGSGAIPVFAVTIALGACGSGGGASASTASPKSAVPAGFMGLVSEDAFAAAPALRASILAGEKRTGVQLLRQTFDWAAMEPGPGRYDFAAYDAYMAATSRAGLDVLPVIFHAPLFRSAGAARGVVVTLTTSFPPSRMEDVAEFATVISRRYGPNGTFWHAHPDLDARPIHAWQVWNEPNLPFYWGGRPSAAAYVRMLRAVHRGIRRVDPNAEIVTAGLPDSRLGVGLTRYVRQMYAAGAKGTFETLALHPYATSAAGVLAAARAVRSLLDGKGDGRASIWITELGWASGGPRSSFTVGERRQAKLVLNTITTLAAEAGALRLRGVVYFNWRDSQPYSGKGDFWGLHTGLLRLDGTGKPALSTYFQAAGVVKKLQR